MSIEENDKIPGFPGKITSDDKEKREKIVMKAEEMFLQHGYSKVTMEEIASNLGMSKKTLYKFFGNKKEVLRSLMTERQCEIMARIDEIWKSDNLGFIGKYRAMVDYISERSSRIHKFEDLQKSEPELWKEMHDFKKGMILEKARECFDAGFESGILRKDIDRSIVVMAYLNAVESIVNPEVLAELPCTGGQAFEAISKIIFEGILSEEGRRKFLSYEAEKPQSNGNGLSNG